MPDENQHIPADHQRKVVDRVIRALKTPDTTQDVEPSGGTPELPASPSAPPWTLQQYFNGEIDLDVELSGRSQNMPVMSTIKFRNMGTQSGRGVATLATQDGAAQVIFDADQSSHVVHISFTLASMLTLRFVLDDLSNMDRVRWLELMRREEGGLAFLWGPSRWENDYLISISRAHFTNLYAFSPHNFEASIRMTPDVMHRLLDWLEEFWVDDIHDDESPELLTW